MGPDRHGRQSGQKPPSVMVERNLKLSASSMGRAQFAGGRLLQLAALARSRRGHSRIALAALAIISPARRPNAATSTGAGGLHERPSSFSCRRSGAFCVCGFRMGKRSFTTHVPIPDKSIPFPHRHARRVSNFIQTADCLVDGKPRSYRDTKSGAMDAATFLKGPTAAQRGSSNVGQLERTFLT